MVPSYLLVILHNQWRRTFSATTERLNYNDNRHDCNVHVRMKLLFL